MDRDELGQALAGLLEQGGVGELWTPEGPSEKGRALLDQLARGIKTPLGPGQQWLLTFADRVWSAEDPRAAMDELARALKAWKGDGPPPSP